MSPSLRDLWPGSRERLLISLAPSELSWVRMHGLLRPAAGAKRIIAVDAGFGARAWDGVIHALRAEAAQWQNEPVAVRIVLSNHFVRYALVPSSDGVSAGDEELALARFHFAKVHGEVSRDWNIRLSPAASTGTRLASAVDNALIDALKLSFPRERRPRLASVQPMLMSVFNNVGLSAVPAKGAWLVMVEADRACVVLYATKSWQAVQNVKGEFADAQAWVRLVERVRWSIPLDSVPETILVYTTAALSQPSQQVQTLGAWKMMHLQTRWPSGTQPARDGAYATALSAA